jgi:hypothetical protein
MFRLFIIFNIVFEAFSIISSNDFLLFILFTYNNTTLDLVYKSILTQKEKKLSSVTKLRKNDTNLPKKGTKT